MSHPHPEYLSPDDPGYDEARRVWNGRFDRRPALICRCASAADVADAVKRARSEGLPVSVKGGGHDYAGNTVGEGSLLIDLGPMDAVSVDPSRRRAVAGPGVRWGGLDAATQAHGLATPGGTVSTVGVAGVALGGGSGWLSRKHGLTVDNLVGAQVVTAEGEIVPADDRENPDLFWGIRGGGGNFGVVTSFEFRLHDVGPEVLAGQILYPAERAPELLRFYRDYFRDAPDALMCYPFLIRIPPVDAFPEAWHGRLSLDFVVAWTGPLAEGERWLAPFREQGETILDFVMPQPYTELQQAFDAGMGAGNRWFSRAGQFDTLTDEAIDTLVAGLDPFPGAFTAVYLGPGGGAIGRVPADATAYPHRGSAHDLHIFAGWADASDDSAVMGWADDLWSALRPHANGRVYVNLLGDGEEDRIADAYRENLARLRALKRRWDPESVFSGNHTIEPEEP